MSLSHTEIHERFQNAVNNGLFYIREARLHHNNDRFPEDQFRQDCLSSFQHVVRAHGLMLALGAEYSNKKTHTNIVSAQNCLEEFALGQITNLQPLGLVEAWLMGASGAEIQDTSSNDIADRLAAEIDEAEEKAIDSLSRYKFQMYGYWAGIWVHLNRIEGKRRPSPFKDLVKAAKEIRDS